MLENTNNTCIATLNLTNFRNYTQRTWEFNNSPVVICGNNGLGKTNILEAISFLSVGRGMRNANLQEITNHNFKVKDSNEWTIFAKIENHSEYSTVATALQVREGGKSNRVVQINQKDSTKPTLNKIINLIWLSPQDDPLFLEPSSTRRKFLDRIVYCIDPTHASRVSAYEVSVRERMKILTEQVSYDQRWLDVLERKIANLGVEIAEKRNETLSHLNHAFKSAYFPKEHVYIDGEIEKMLSGEGDVESVRDFYVKSLNKNRSLDSRNKKTNIGVHKSDLKVIYKDKNVEARFCSTGEQKSLLLSLTLAKARMCKMLNRPVPILLLDEVTSHLDKQKRNELFQEIVSLNTQCFLTGTSASLFDSLVELNQNTQLVSLS